MTPTDAALYAFIITPIVAFVCVVAPFMRPIILLVLFALVAYCALFSAWAVVFALLVVSIPGFVAVFLFDFGARPGRQKISSVESDDPDFIFFPPARRKITIITGTSKPSAFGRAYFAAGGTNEGAANFVNSGRPQKRVKGLING